LKEPGDHPIVRMTFVSFWFIFGDSVLGLSGEKADSGLWMFLTCLSTTLVQATSWLWTFRTSGEDQAQPHRQAL
jgi:hypothetical protein